MKQTYSILVLLTALFLSSCTKEDWRSSPTALNFATKDVVVGGKYKYVYTCYKYNSQSYFENPTTKESWNDLLVLEVFSNSDKPMNQWIDYPHWMRDTMILTFRNNELDSIPTLKWRYIPYAKFKVAPVRNCIVTIKRNELLEL